MNRVQVFAAMISIAGCSMPNPAFNGEGPLAQGEGSESSGESEGGDSDFGGEESASDSASDSASSSASAGDEDGGPGGDGDPAGDGDGEPAGDGDGEPLPSCAAPEFYADCDLSPAGLTDDPLRALGLGCEGPAEQTIIVKDSAFEVIDPDSWRIASHFGYAEGDNYDGWKWAARDTAVIPGSGEQPDTAPNTSGAMLVLTTGLLPEVDEDGGVVLAPGIQVGLNDNANEGAPEFPPPISAKFGSNGGQGGTPFEGCDGINDCSDSLHDQWYVQGWNSLHDRLWLRFSLEVPAGVHGYMFDFAFFSSEYPTYVDTQFNDMFVAWTSSPSYTGTLTFIGEAPMNATSLAEIEGFAHTAEDPELWGTGFEGHGATDWLLARGPAVPGETVEITLYLSDLGDVNNGSVVLLDNFRWDCSGCTGEDCGFNP